MIAAPLILLALSTLGTALNIPVLPHPPLPSFPPIPLPIPIPLPPHHPPPPPPPPSHPSPKPSPSPSHPPPKPSPSPSPSPSPTPLPPSITFNTMQMNIRFDAEPDNITIAESIAALTTNNISTPSSYYMNSGERPWSARRLPLTATFKRRHTQLFAVEEALVRQVNDIQELMGSDYAHFGVARDDNTTDNASNSPDNELGPIFWNTSMFQPLKMDTFWLSDMPFDIGTKAPQAGNPRICTTIQFNSSVGIFTAMSTHWDDQSDAGREVGASLILHRANYEALTTKRPVLLFGDFNSVAVNLTTAGCNSCTNGAYLMITGASPPLALNQTFLDRFPVPANAQNFRMIDLKTVAPPEKIYGDYATFSGFDGYGVENDMKRIDFIMTGSNGGFDVEDYGVEENLTDDGMHTSDHRAVLAQLTLHPGSFPVPISN